MLKFVHLNYHFHKEFTNPVDVIKKHNPTSGFIHHLRHRVQFISVKHANYKGEKINNGICYFFFKSNNSFWYIPFATHRFIKKEAPDIILTEGFVFPLQVMALRLTLGKQCKIIAQHHGEKPFRGIKRFLQKIASRWVDAFIFTSLGNATGWIDKGIVDREKCYEVLSASTSMIRKCKQESKVKLGLTGNNNFLWVGRLNANKDPLTVLTAFEKYVSVNTEAKLFMIYQTEDLLPGIKNLLAKNEGLKNSVVLIGKKDRHELADWYSAADYFVSGSHNEGSGYALVEAMTCGCIPIVTDIPSFRKITANGAYGILYLPGNANDLYEKIFRLNTASLESYSTAIEEYAKKQLSCEAIANQVYDICLELIDK